MWRLGGVRPRRVADELGDIDTEAAEVMEVEAPAPDSYRARKQVS